MTQAIIETNYGEIVIDFFDEVTNTVKNFVSLTESGFYDGLTFHRCILDFVAQGGCPENSGLGGPGYSIPCETEKNTSKHRHIRGALSMAHAGKDTGGSQFFLVRAPQPHLDGKHTVFGQIIEGLDIIDKLNNGDKMIKVIIKDISPVIENHQLIKI
ncbi:MAG: peptidylprolyl isomerase [Candidatus Heimdallarchaeota archaeon]|nr:MAG: peptidylprolyl isomerase [Candidatus Heimdallarchaeota archaeon]